MKPIPSRALWVRMPRFIGDGIMISQALEPLRQQLGLPLVAWGPGSVVDLYDGGNAFEAVCPDEQSGRQVWALARLLRSHRALGVLSLTRSLRPLLAGWLARTPLRIGWADHGGAFLATHALPFYGDLAAHHIDRYQTLIRLAYPELKAALPIPLRPRAEAGAMVEALLQRQGFPADFVACALGGNEWNKRLGLPVWTGLLQAFEPDGRRVVLLGNGREDQELAEAMAARFPATWNLVGQLRLSETAALLLKARALIGNDSALPHLAAAVGCPVVAVFGPTRPEWTAPRGSRVQVVRREDLPCVPCAVHGCSVPGHPCMEAVPPASILAALAAVLEPEAPQ